MVLFIRRSLEEKYSVKETQENGASLQKELSNIATEALGIGRESNEVRIGGRKMAMILKEDGEMASTSSTDSNASKKGPHDFLNSQGQENKQDKMTICHSQSSPKQGLSRSVASPSSLSRNELFHHESDEWRKLLEEADKKVMQMMRRDYGGMKRPRRKPPINNHQPRN
ncbi:hypothetical protein E3N88_20099 [Mikania micrantha]|uniref:Uncharacterized protein n=1 Tax=Mikania micrantha TaxID=192012 RepID=A0A5N6NG16_9ASTR|nr:hypothetical protein E3N88_20099 [Mikania micrantha]